MGRKINRITSYKVINYKKFVFQNVILNNNLVYVMLKIFTTNYIKQILIDIN